ncbi:DNA polymerase I [Citricoccus parietis]|uniref:DNA polymerase I n=1 Tax=Citricoccus parietis TaxID=592307 RepID=UPI00406B9E49
MTIRLAPVTDSSNPVPDSAVPAAPPAADQRLLVIDGHSMAFRAFYALPVDNFATDTGQHTNAVYGFTTMLLTMIRQQKPTHVAVAFDLDTPTFRSEEYTEYKAGRSKTPEEFHGQINLIIKVMEAMNIPTVSVDGFEADDIVATFAAQAEAAGWDTRVVSGDRDAFQLITEQTTVLYPKKGVSDIPPMDAAAIIEKYGVAPERYPDLAALVGETADNLPGVPGVGPKTAAKWINLYGTVEDVLEHADEIKGKAGQSLRDHADDVRRNRRLNHLLRDMELPVALEATELTHPDHEQVEELFDALQFNTVRQRLFDTLAERLGGEPESAPVEATPEFTVLTPDAAGAAALESFLSEHAANLMGVHVVLDGPAILPKRKIPAPGDYGVAIGAALVAEVSGGAGTAGTNTGQAAKAAVYVDLWLPSGSTSPEDTTPDAGPGRVLAAYLAEAGHPKAIYDLKAVAKSLSAAGHRTALGTDLVLAGVVDDVLLSAYLIQPDRRSYGLDALVQTYLQSTLEMEDDPTQAGDQLELDLDSAVEAGASSEGAALQARAAASVRAGWMVRRLSEVFSPALIERGAQQLLLDLEIPLAEVMVDMELAGIAVDRPVLDGLFADFTERMEAAQESAWASVSEVTGGEKVNLGSPKQLQALLFEKLDMPKTRKTKTGYSTDVDSLNDLLNQTQHPFLENLMLHRDATKLRQTVEGLRDTVAEDGRIHTTYSQTAAATGRLSSLHPNLQNIPVRTEAGRKIRDVFVVGEGYGTLLTADYSQIEMRIMAHLSEDEALIQAFRDGEDLHRFVGAQVFGVDPADVSGEMRAKVKAMSYGLAYGLSSFGLSKQLQIPVDEARGLMKGYFDRFGAVRDYLKDVVSQARQDGFTATIKGRRRYLPDLNSDNRQLRDMAERAALNAPIQGSAADIIKQAMLDVQLAINEQGLRSRMLLQVHDELILEVPDDELEAATALLEDKMGHAAQLTVPLDVNVGVGRSWHDAAH